MGDVDQSRAAAAGTGADGALGAVELAIKAATAYGRPDLARRVRDRRERLVERTVRVLVVGEFKQGKSSLVNALVGAPVCPVDDDVATTVPTAVRHRDEPCARVAYATDDGGEPEWEPADVEAARRLSTGTPGPGDRRPVMTEIGIPRRLLAGGLVLVDTPGVGGIGSPRAASTASSLPSADLVLFITDASQELTAPELEFLQAARALCPAMACVLTKIDLYPQWRTIRDLDQHHLERAGLVAPIVAVSSLLRQHAASSNDQELNTESGFPALIEHLRHSLATARTTAAEAAAQDVVDVARQLEASFEAERSALVDPQRVGELMARLTLAQREADRLRGQTSKWQQRLNDRIADLGADVDHDLRSRMREVTRVADETIDDGDPRALWAEFEPWLYRRVAAEVLANYALLHQRAALVANEVGALFDAEESEVLAAFPVSAPTEILGNVVVDTGLDDAPSMSVGQSALSLLRGSYGGVLMFGMLGRMVGLGLANPASIFLGLMMGRKSMRDEKDRQLTQARQQARQACHRYVDEVVFVIGKDSRDTVRRLHRHLRDHFAERAETLHRSASDSLRAAQEAVKGDETQRRDRLRRVDTELARIRGLAARGAAVAPSSPSAPAAAGRR